VSASLAITLDVKLNDDLNFVPNIGLNYNYLISGFQVLYGEVFNLKENEDFVPFSYSITPGFYLSKSLTPYMSFHFGYNFVFDFMTEEEVSELQSYNLESHTVFVGAAFNLGSLKKHSRNQELVEKKLLKLERSYSTIVNASEDHKLHVDSIFISGTNLNSKLQSEIENHIASLDISQDSSDPDFVFLFPSKDSIYYSLFDDTMLDLLSTANSQDDLNIKIVGYADLKGDDQNNLYLSKNRTETIRNSLIDSGVSPNRIRVEFLGETSMFDSNVFMSNRRVEIFISTN
jgi:outer membrane protein OmpA-like peptidoglycan-associated protein